jgi:hypothetical protein
VTIKKHLDANITGGASYLYGSIEYNDEQVPITGITLAALFNDIIYWINNNAIGAKGRNGEIFNDYDDNLAEGDYSHAEGIVTQSSGDASHAEGRGSRNNGTYYITYVDSTTFTLSGNSSIQVGERISYDENYADVWDVSYNSSTNLTTIKLTQSIGLSPGSAYVNKCYGVASGDYSHSEGNCTVAYGDASHAEGYYTLALDH